MTVPLKGPPFRGALAGGPRTASFLTGPAGHRSVVWAWVLGILAAVVFIVVPIHYFNRGIQLQNRCRESWSNVETELRRRYDLIPNLVRIVRGAMRHEREVLMEVTHARADALAAHGPPGEQAAAERPLVEALDRLLAIAEAYPALRAGRSFRDLQKELAITEDRIQAARRFYNGNVRDYRNHVRQFPGNMFATLYRWGTIDFFEVDPVHVDAPKVDA